MAAEQMRGVGILAAALAGLASGSALGACGSAAPTPVAAPSALAQAADRCDFIGNELGGWYSDDSPLLLMTSTLVYNSATTGVVLWPDGEFEIGALVESEHKTYRRGRLAPDVAQRLHTMMRDAVKGQPPTVNLSVYYIISHSPYVQFFVRNDNAVQTAQVVSATLEDYMDPEGQYQQRLADEAALPEDESGMSTANAFQRLPPPAALAAVYRALFEAMDAPSTVHLDETTWRNRDEYDDLAPRAEELISINARCRK